MTINSGDGVFLPEANSKFYREDIDESECVISEDDRPPTYVNIDDVNDVICNKHRLEMTPRERRQYIKIEDVPYKNPKVSITEAIFNREDATEDEEFELSDDEADAALVSNDEAS